MSGTAAFLFDLDGTLVDSVYNHVRAWHVALREHGLDLSVWRIHRKIGMSGGLFTAQLQRELGRPIDEPTLQRLRDRHAELFRELSKDVPPLPGGGRAARRADEAEAALGHRNERPDAYGGDQPSKPRRRSR